MTDTAERRGLVYGLDEAEYHADRGSLSVSGAKTLLKAPALFKWQQDHPVQKAAYDFGSAVHAAVLGAGIEQIYVAPYDDWRTKAAQAERAIAYEERLSPILPEQWAEACELADAVRTHRVAAQLLSEGIPEVSAYCMDDATGILRRGRFDWLHPRFVVDLKTSKSSDPDPFIRNDATPYRYYQQAAWYLDLARDLGHPAEGFVLIVTEKEPPHLTTVLEFDYDALERGRELNARALEIYRDCTESGFWPGYTRDDEIVPITLPPWAFYDKDPA